MLFLILAAAMEMIGIDPQTGGDTATTPDAAAQAADAAAQAADAASDLIAPLEPLDQSPDAAQMERFPVFTYGTETETVFVSAAYLNSDQQVVFENEFDVGEYFSAFAIGKNGGYGYSISGNDMESARAVALAECQRYQARCRLYAEIYPLGYQPTPAGMVTMGSDALQYYPTLNSRELYYSMAVAPDGAYSVGWSYPDQLSADIGTLADCEGYRSTDLPGFESTGCVLIEMPN